MWQADLHGVAKFVRDGLEEYANAGPLEGQTSDQPQVAGADVITLSL